MANTSQLIQQRQQLTPGLLTPEEEQDDAAILETLARGALRKGGGLLGEVVNPPEAGRGSDVRPEYRTMPLQAKEVFALLRRGVPIEEGFTDYTRRTQQGVPSEFFDLKSAKPAMDDVPDP